MLIFDTQHFLLSVEFECAQSPTLISAAGGQILVLARFTVLGPTEVKGLGHPEMALRNAVFRMETRDRPCDRIPDWFARKLEESR